MHLPVCHMSACYSHCFLKFLILAFLPVSAVIRQCVNVSVCLSSSLSVYYLFIYCLSCLFGVLCWLEAQLPSFTVKCWADWKGHFSNGAALPLIFCLSLGVRLIYHAPSPADIQIHFDWQLDRMTPTTSNTETPLQRLHTHTVKCDALHTRSQVHSGYEYAYSTNTFPLTLEDMHLHT